MRLLFSVFVMLLLAGCTADTESRRRDSAPALNRSSVEAGVVQTVPRAIPEFDELPALCQLVLADSERYTDEADWHGCASCSRVVGNSVASARRYYASRGDPAFEAEVAEVRSGGA